MTQRSVASLSASRHQLDTISVISFKIYIVSHHTAMSFVIFTSNYFPQTLWQIKPTVQAGTHRPPLYGHIIYAEKNTYNGLFFLMCTEYTSNFSPVMHNRRVHFLSSGHPPWSARNCMHTACLHVQMTQGTDRQGVRTCSWIPTLLIIPPSTVHASDWWSPQNKRMSLSMDCIQGLYWIQLV